MDFETITPIVISWIPLVLILGVFWWWYSRKTGLGRTGEQIERSFDHMERSEEHMARVEGKLDELLELLRSRGTTR